MSKSKQALAEAVLARISLGAVPMDGMYWFDPKGFRAREQNAQPDREKADAEKANQVAAGNAGEGHEHRSV